MRRIDSDSRAIAYVVVHGCMLVASVYFFARVAGAGWRRGTLDVMGTEDPDR